MNNTFFIVKAFTLLIRHKPWRLVMIFGLTLFLGISSGFSILLLIPLLQLLNINAEGTADEITVFLNNMASKAGIDLSIETILLIYVTLLTFTALLQYWKSILNGRYQQTFVYELRRRIFRKIILADWSLLNNKSKTNNLQVLTKEVPNMTNFLSFYLGLFTNLIYTASYIAYAMIVSTKFTLLTVAIGIVLFVVLRKFLFRSFQLGKGYVVSYNQLLKYIDDFWQTVKIAKVHSSENFYYTKFDEASTSLLDLEFRMQKNWSLPQLIYRITGIVSLSLIIYAAYKLVLMPLASFFVLILLFSRIFPQFSALNTDINMILSNIPSLKLVIQWDDEFKEPSFFMKTDHETLPLEVEINLDVLNFSYPDGEQLFKEFSETIPANKIIGIIGESGRGKTTLIDLIAGLQKPDSGTIRVDSRLLDETTLPHWRSSIGYLPQDSFFIDGSLRENLVWDSSHSISDDEIMDVLRKVNAVSLAERLPNRLDTPVVNYQFHFSGGERQRLALARVLLRHPRLLLLDEATSSLDLENENQVMEVISGLKSMVTIIFVTHRASLLPWFDKVIKI